MIKLRWQRSRVLEELDIIVVGGGAVGLALARAFALRGREVTLLEAERQLASHASSRNSEVIHAGIYYRPWSLKAQLCVRGRALLYEYCQARNVLHRRLGKVIVASGEHQLAELRRLRRVAQDNGVDDLQWLDAREVERREPEVVADAGLWSPSTGIIDSHQLVASYKADAVAAGAVVVTECPVLGGQVAAEGVRVRTGGSDPAEVTCRLLVNAAGLGAQRLATALEGLPRETVPPQHLAKGQYFQLRGRSPFRHLVYPTPVGGGLGIHVTLDAAGVARFGPDVTWVEHVDYDFDEARLPAFVAAIQSYYPGLDPNRLVAGYTGIRSKLVGPGQPPADFVIQGPEQLGLPVVNLYGIESPGLTASLAIAEHVVGMIAS